MNELQGYKEHLDQRWDDHYGFAAMDRQTAQEAALQSAGLPEATPGDAQGAAPSTPEPKADTTGSHAPNALEGLAWVGETLSAPIRMLITKHAMGKDPVATGKDGEYTGEDFSRDLGLKGEGTPLWKNVLGTGAEILTDPTSAIPLGGKVTQKAVTAAKDALSKTGEVTHVIEELQGVPRSGAPTLEQIPYTERVVHMRQADGSYVDNFGEVYPSGSLSFEPLTEKAFGFVKNGSRLDEKRSAFISQQLRESAALAGLDAASYQKVFASAQDVIEKFNLQKDLTKLLADPAAQEFVERGQLAAKVMGNEAGGVNIAATLLMARLMVGAGVGAATADENKLQGALTGVGIAASPELIGTLLKASKKLLPEAAKVVTPKAPPAWSTDYAKQRFATLTQELKDKAAAEVKRPLSAVDQEAEALLKYQDVSMDTLKLIKPNAVINDAEMRATQMVLKESADHLYNMASTMDVKDPAQLQEFLKQLYHHGNADFGRGYAESGLARALGVIDAHKADQLYLDEMNRAVKNFASGVNPTRIVEMVRNIESPDHLLKFANAMKQPSFKDMFVEYWVNGLLSGPATYALNMGGSALFHGLNMFEKGMSALYGNASAPTEALAMLQGTFAGMTNAFRLSWEVAKAETKASLKGQSTERIQAAITGENVASLTRLVSPDKLNTEKYGVVSTLADYLGWMGDSAVNVAGTVARHPRIAMVSQDEFTKSIAASAEIYRHAALNAAADVETAGLTGKAARELYAERKKFWISNPAPDAIRSGKDYGAYITFMKELGPTGKAVQELTKNNLLAKLALPIVTAPVNVAKAGFLERTPLGLVSKTFRQELAAGGQRKQMALTRMSLGASVLAMGTSWAANGIITAPAPESTEMKKAMRGEGVLPLSLNITALMNGGPTKEGDARPQPGDKLVDLARLDPALMPALTLSVLLTQAAGSMNEQDYSDVSAELAVALGERIAEKTAMTGIARFTSVLSDPHRNLEGYLRQSAGSLLPASSLSNAITRQLDPIRRDPQDIVQAFMAKIPGLSTKVIPDRNRYGEEVRYTPGLGPDIASPVYMDTVKDTRLVNALVEDEVNFSKMPKTLGNIILTPKLYDELRVIMGQEVINSKGQTLKESEYAILKEAEQYHHTTGPKSWRAAQLMRNDHEFREKARKILLRRNPDLAQAALDDDRARLKQLDKHSQSSLLGDMINADLDGVDVKPGRSKSANIPFKVR